MDAKPLASLNIDPRLIQEIAQTTLESMVAQSLGDPKSFIQAIVSNALNFKVDPNTARKNEYSSYNTMPYIDAVAGVVIREKCKEVIREFIEQRAGEIKEAVRKELEKRDRKTSLAKAILDATEDALTCKWDFKCDVSFNKENK
jgi:hypothetical protein